MSNPFETPHARCATCGNGFYPEAMPEWARRGCGCPNPECSRARFSDAPRVEIYDPAPRPEIYNFETIAETHELESVSYAREMWTKGKMHNDMPRWWTWVESSR